MTVTDSPSAATALRSDWRTPAAVGPATLSRFYAAAVLHAGPVLRVVGLDPDPLGTADVQFTVTTTLVPTPRGLRLLPVEPEYALPLAERVRPRREAFDSADCSGL